MYVTCNVHALTAGDYLLQVGLIPGSRSRRLNSFIIPLKEFLDPDPHPGLPSKYNRFFGGMC